MAILPFLAMTAAEIRNISDSPPKLAWMACHFSPHGNGLANLPQQLPPHSILILDDSTPINGHDHQKVSAQLQGCVETFQCCCVLLDFQRPGDPDTAALAEYLIQHLPCPAILSAYYANDFTSPVFLPPVPPSVTLGDYLTPWKGRDIWLEIGLTGELLTLTEQGCIKAPLPFPGTDSTGFQDSSLHCHYYTEISKKSARFTLWRTWEDWLELLQEAEQLEVSGAIGLFQELRDFPLQM